MDWLALQNKAAIVTGGGMGLGLAIGRALASCGARVTVADISEDAGNAAVRDLPGASGAHHFVKTNVADRTQVRQLVADTAQRCGGVDILVNNAGINIPRLLVDPAGKQQMSDDVWDRVTEINLKGAYLCAQAFCEQCVRDGRPGVLVNMASESGLEGSAGQSIYAATKAALYSLTRSWAKELGAHGIRVVGLAPGILEETAMRSPAYEEALAYTRGLTVEQLRAGYEKVSIPLGRSGRLQEVADLVCYLASDRASYVHGTVVNISGGKSRA